MIAANARCLGRIGKAVAAAIAVEHVGPVVGHIEVWATVVVDVAHGHATAPAGIADPSFSGDFHKSAVAAIAVERVARPRAVAVRGKGGPVGYVEVEVAVGVVVEEGCTAAMRL